MSEHDRHIVIKARYTRGKNLAKRVSNRLGISTNAAEMAACQYAIEKIWDEFEPDHLHIMACLKAPVKYLDGKESGGYLKRMLPRCLTFTTHPDVPCTNNYTEGPVRWNVVCSRSVF